MEAKENILTKEGLAKYEDELHELKTVKLKEVAEKLKEAREQGDLSENAEYDAAKDEQRDIAARIEVIEKILKNAEVIDDSDVDTNKISIGCTVKLKDLEFDEEIEYKIPVGKALIGAKKGQTVSVETQAGVFKYKVLGIQRSEV